MPNASDILWFKVNFGASVAAVAAGTPFDLDMVTAIACQETGHIWSVLRHKNMPVARILELCVGDTLDAPKRSAFPKTKADLVSAPNGQQMFNIARAALVDMAQFVPGFPVSNPDKFCHGYGIFQYDIQFFQVDPQYFLQRRYVNFADSLGKCLQELKAAAKRIGYQAKTHLTDAEKAAVAIAYNTGRYNPAKGLKQGYFDGTKYYGERFADFLALAQSVAAPPAAPVIVAVPVTPGGNGQDYRVETNGSTLRLRSSPAAVPGNVIASLPDGQIVRALDSTATSGFRHVETDLGGQHLTGFAGAAFLAPVSPDEAPIIVATPTG